MKQLLQILVGLFAFSFANLSLAKNYNVIRLSCQITGDEISLTPNSLPGPRIRKAVYTEKITYVLDRLVYLSDGPAAVSPLSQDISVALPHLSEDKTSLLEAFESPAGISVSRRFAQTTVSVNLSRNLLIDLLDALGSPTASALSEAPLDDVVFEVKRYYAEPRLWANSRPYQTGDSFDFTGWYGVRSLETCYQIDPLGLDLPEDPYFNQLAYHICGACQAELLEASSTTFKPVFNSLDPK